MQIKSLQIVILTRHRPHQLRECLISLARAAHRVSAGSVGLIVIINGPDPNALKVIDEVTREGQMSVRTVSLDQAQKLGRARNAAIPFLHAPWTLFLDDDVRVPEHFLKHFLNLAIPDATAILGGPNLTPPSANLMSEMNGLALSSRWGAWDCHRRYKQCAPHSCVDSSLTLCNLFVRTSVFLSAGFNSELDSGEECDFMTRFHRAGHLLHYDPELFVYHHRRNTWSRIGEQLYRYGHGRGECAARGQVQFFHLVPTLALTLWISMLSLQMARTAAILGLAYGTVTFATALVLTKQREFRASLVLFEMFIVFHLAYAVGVPVGFLRAQVRVRKSSLAH